MRHFFLFKLHLYLNLFACFPAPKHLAGEVIPYLVLSDHILKRVVCSNLHTVALKNNIKLFESCFFRR